MITEWEGSDRSPYAMTMPIETMTTSMLELTIPHHVPNMPKRDMITIFRIILPRGATMVMVPFRSETETGTLPDIASANACSWVNVGCSTEFIMK